MRFSETVVPEEFFDELLASLDESTEVVEALARAAERADSSMEKR